jgi:transposase
MSKAKKKSNAKDIVAMDLVHANAAGIDVGDTLHSVAVPAGRDEVKVKEFGAFTSDLTAIAEWLKKCRITTVAMESTGVYWKNLFMILVQEGFEVYLVQAKHTRNITGRKTDESDAEWIQKLHSCALLSSSFLPDSLTESLRSVVRFRRSLTENSSQTILRMQKAMEMMNIKLHTVISDITGKTGTAVTEAILAGERNPEAFLPLIDCRIKADKETIKKSLEGNWREEHLYLLKENYEIYNFYKGKISDCDKEISKLLETVKAAANEGIIEESCPSDQMQIKDAEQRKTKKKTKNQPAFDTREKLKQVLGVDVIDIYGISEITALEIFSETGPDLSKWHNENHFVSWLNLCPNNKISGGKLISSKLLGKKPNPAAQAFRMAANSLKTSDNWLGDYFRRKRAKGGHKYAIVATARKLAIIYYKMARYRQPFMPVDFEEYQVKYRKIKIEQLEKKLQHLKAMVA